MLQDYRCIATSVATFFAFVLVSGQDPCESPRTQEIFHGNDIRTSINTSGNVFQLGENAQFQVPYTGPETPNAVFASGLWLGAVDLVDNLKIAAQTYHYSDFFDYRPGPLTEVGTITSETCADWDRVWKVTRHQIRWHIADYADNGIIDDPITNIFAWPGKGNTDFESYTGLELTDTPGFGAPFRDVNNNGTYEPDQGEYPCVPSTTLIAEDVHPMMMTWTVFNDNGGLHRVSGADALRAEVHLTTYAFSCEDIPLLNQTIFLSYKILNRSTSVLDSMRIGHFADPDLGCFTDDYFGSYPEGNSYFFYNADNVDGSAEDQCPSAGGALNTYGENPPALSVTFLNRDLESLGYFNNPGIGATPVATHDPQFGAPVEFYRILRGLWRDGTPMSDEGSGYQIPVGNPTPFAFTGDPNDTASWAMTNVDLALADRRVVGGASLPRLDPGQSVTLDMAYSYHRDTSLSNLGNVALMYDRIEALRGLYDSGFEGMCTSENVLCAEDCVYPGDTDQNGKVTMADYLNPPTAIAAIGPKRFGPLGFIPLSADDWGATNPEGVELKHVDANGDGVIQAKDLEITTLNYGLAADWYTAAPDNHGDDIVIVPEDDSVEASAFFTRVTVDFASVNVDSLYGLVYALEYDTTYFDQAIASGNTPIISGPATFVKRNSDPGREESVTVALDAENREVQPGTMMQMTFFLSNNLAVSGGIDTTYLEIKDVKAIMHNGEVVPLLGQKRPLYLVEETSSSRHVIRGDLEIYPNPSKGTVYLGYPDAEESAAYRVITLQGHPIANGKLTGMTTELKLQPGVYQVVVYGRMIRTGRVIVVD